jgi:hypothetical protein
MAACLTTLLGALFNSRIARFLKNVNRLGRKIFAHPAEDGSAGLE